MEEQDLGAAYILRLTPSSHPSRAYLYGVDIALRTWTHACSLGEDFYLALGQWFLYSRPRRNGHGDDTR